ncbi:hypothetical protein GCM10009133_16320 [Cocleimonas flava]|uniref:DUF4178 domain-containing protein n=2 Tax=Cocleimonas flava TaxID=634765 RepID=A0A4R1F2I0_9GAMM|nr:hypothetical protein EV695_2519 [Cocleimonas flava]
MKQLMNTIKKAQPVQCTNCHAPFEIIGNPKRCQLLVCGYCGTVMDYKNDLRALYAYTEVQKPASHLRIGMQANIEGIAFTISALVVYETLQGKEEDWVEYQLYAPNYGYALLIIKDGVCCFLRKTYHLPKPNVWLLKAGDSFLSKGQQYIIDQFSLTRVLHSEGALLDKIKQDKRDKQVFARVGDQCFYSKYNLNKVIYYQGFYIDKQKLEDMFV